MTVAALLLEGKRAEKQLRRGLRAPFAHVLGRVPRGCGEPVPALPGLPRQGWAFRTPRKLRGSQSHVVPAPKRRQETRLPCWYLPPYFVLCVTWM